ncbi:MAG: sodium:calcium antiporter [Desulfurococcales archaeon]|jgi:cation:H+ antiporter|nr:sodium:calcium antiporter [Desulfurococcales archaeon]
MSLLGASLEILIGIGLVILAGIMVEELVDWISWRINKSSASIAMILAPLMTSAPEMAVFVIALVEGKKNIAWGTIVSQPFMASTIIYPAVVLVAIASYYFGKRKSRVVRVHKFVAVPLLAFTLPLLPIMFLHPETHGIYGRIYGIVIIAVYFIYSYFMLRGESNVAKEPSLRLKLPFLQVGSSVVMLYVGGELMVRGIYALGILLNMNETALSVLIVPLATVVPESIVGLVFIVKNRDDEGISAIVGEKALYGTFYPGLAMALGAYTLDFASKAALEIALVVSPIESIAIWFGYFGVTAPIGILGYILYLIKVLMI